MKLHCVSNEAISMCHPWFGYGVLLTSCYSGLIIVSEWGMALVCSTVVVTAPTSHVSWVSQQTSSFLPLKRSGGCAVMRCCVFDKNKCEVLNCLLPWLMLGGGHFVIWPGDRTCEDRRKKIKGKKKRLGKANLSSFHCLSEGRQSQSGSAGAMGDCANNHRLWSLHAFVCEKKKKKQEKMVL